MGGVLIRVGWKEALECCRVLALSGELIVKQERHLVAVVAKLTEFLQPKSPPSFIDIYSK